MVIIKGVLLGLTMIFCYHYIKKALEIRAERKYKQWIIEERIKEWKKGYEHNPVILQAHWAFINEKGKR